MLFISLADFLHFFYNCLIIGGIATPIALKIFPIMQRTDIMVDLIEHENIRIDFSDDLCGSSQLVVLANSTRIDVSQFFC
ncbi:MAG: hypothetical protein GH151_00285 [Bacteroidetes bacterium]|nr:hypothetical protein [Bacteroidota bacterium]